MCPVDGLREKTEDLEGVHRHLAVVAVASVAEMRAVVRTHRRLGFQRTRVGLKGTKKEAERMEVVVIVLLDPGTVEP